MSAKQSKAVHDEDEVALQGLTAEIIDLAEKVSDMTGRFFDRDKGSAFQIPDPLLISKAFAHFALHIAANPTQLLEAQAELARDSFSLMRMTLQRLVGGKADPVMSTDKYDRRFKDPDWNEKLIFDVLKQMYLVYAHWLGNMAESVETDEPHIRKMVEFYTDRLAEAASPTNFPITNPAVLRKIKEDKGLNLWRGFRNLLHDVAHNQTPLQFRLSDDFAFDVGRNIAFTPGKVVMENDLMQLIQYSPTTEKARKTPLMIVPPWINKFYILDLQEHNSFIRWAVAQGHTVFVISWVNPDGRHRDKMFDDYMLEGPIAALDAIEQQTGEKQVNAIGYCIGGTLMAGTAAWLKAKKRDALKSLTFFTTMIDFSDPGDLGVFVDDDQLALIEEHVEGPGYMESHHMAGIFNLMRANDLIWSTMVDQYLLGNKPRAFDILYWNGDATRMPAGMHLYYLKNMYIENNLVKPGCLEYKGEKIDLSLVEDLPIYFLSTREDHIAPWMSTYQGAHQFSKCKPRFVLAGSGHVAGVVNPPSRPKYGYWTNDSLPHDPHVWLDTATEREGSWWTDWNAWMEQHTGGEIPARNPEDGKLEIIEDAPGSYVRVKADQ